METVDFLAGDDVVYGATTDNLTLRVEPSRLPFALEHRFPNMNGSLRRREILAGSAGVGLASVAGCTDFANPGDEDGAEFDVDSAAVVSQHELATVAGLEVLEAGGTAADAAVAVACSLSVVEPWFSSALGGGTWALYYDAEADEVTSVDGVGPVGSEATAEDFEERAGEDGVHQAVVPGAWDGWMLWLEAYGELDLDEVLSPAIETAREGYPASPELIDWLGTRSDQIDRRPAAAEIYRPDGDALEEGDTVYQEEMAETFEALAAAYEDELDEADGETDDEDGNGTDDEARSAAIQAARDYFYRGPIAEAIVDRSDEEDGYLTLEDFEAFEAEIVDPISITYDESDGVEVYQNPPNSQGITQLMALNVLKAVDFDDLESDDADAVHAQAEAIKLAFADRYHHVGDPDRVDVPVEDLLDEDYGAEQADRIDPEEAMEWPVDTGLESETTANAADADHTTTFHVVDEDGNAAAVTTSLGAQFLVVGDTGIHLNNRMRMLSVEEDDPNRIEPGYKVRHTSNPYMALRDGQPYVLGGNTGVDTQPQGQTQQFLHVHEFGHDAQSAVDHPRFVSSAFPPTDHPWVPANELEMEEFPEDVIADLEAVSYTHL
ncbi:gamma-glutamyltransferase family protein [Natronolimnohabitans innermongolicus]|uniref:Gamma-glutamyltransferase n=1 Tax=Natronolimnohabitans innermongolicus JCM 12255 TaxID=1227499 RepID=L9WYF9_9EURY|nr:gamma-glutamyltransferase [Natronolimnohabitans innermongolicus]ELY54495.1 gamma-glutamyltransferase [Natronolimnohabitans innermongolicus JCM 12255]